VQNQGLALLDFTTKKHIMCYHQDNQV